MGTQAASLKLNVSNRRGTAVTAAAVFPLTLALVPTTAMRFRITVFPLCNTSQRSESARNSGHTKAKAFQFSYKE